MEKGVAINPSELTVKENCTGCGACIVACPAGALSLETEAANGWGQKKAIVDLQNCLRCEACIPTCPRQSLFLLENA